ncbi:hypothetical protein [Rhizobium oryzicola]|uniref:Uncharacterized protein n=1 Tax=Rhizobium oryzicola TaxID=1232668 RepID=A0ABT8T037_9HYPH|nr:hypothetical protein [Rhizobium oryzicola]MDO1583508.1 hypothetical protein [Rhizobium oryzicola]
MTKVVIIGIEGESGLWVADLGAGTVTKAPQMAASTLEIANEPNSTGAAITKGINLAVVAASAESLSGGYMDR